MSALKQLKQLKPETPEQREQRQRFHKRRKKAGIKEVRRYVDVNFLRFYLVYGVAFLPRGVDYDADDLVAAFLAFEAETHGR